MFFYPKHEHRVIAHVDADAFFASCEQALHPELKGRPVITGKERGIVSAASYEAKALGIKRGVPLQDVKKICPDAVILPSDYENYSLFSKRMFDVLRRYSPSVEEYSIDEAFVDLTGLRRPLNKTYLEMGQTFQQDIENELGITVSVGISTSKVLAKLASKWNKPNGFLYISRRDIDQYLGKVTIDKVWGIGPQTTNFLLKQNIKTPLDFIKRPEEWIRKNLTKPHQEIWEELNGDSVYNVEAELKEKYQTITKTKTFTPATSDPVYVFGQLSKNIENACIKARRYKLGTKRISIFLKDQEYNFAGMQSTLSRNTAYPKDIMQIARKMFEQVYCSSKRYRATGVLLHDLDSLESLQLNLFETPIQVKKQEHIFESIDELSKRFGKHTVFLGSSFPVHTKPDRRYTERLPQNNNEKIRRQEGGRRKFIGLPVLDVEIR
ncbi:DNA polymerase IV [Patescibacteria group bacterium]